MYETGRGTALDYNQARAWYLKSAEQGNERAKEALRRL
ncbi:MAG: SEL1-like repeat protein [Synergistaceae bacterium]|nr:SEL1-like repeat protein [Synergistaceae bacterium]